MELSDALWALESGFCLWVGAGITKQVAAGKASVPLWDQVAHEMESVAGVEPFEDEDVPTRLDRCLHAIGGDAFGSHLREWFYTDLSAGLLSHAVEFVDAEDFVPQHLRSIAALGQLANPIVSFNIEPLSSLLLARPAGPFRILFQSATAKPTYTWRELGGRFQRIVYHPHGLATADSVMTASQYKSNRETLAFRLAIHAAFGNTLAIVGMSLDDKYLRHQIKKSRTSLGDVYWFGEEFPDKLANWASQHRIETVQVHWPEFWNRWRELPVDIASSDLCSAWYLAVSEATEEVEGGFFGGLLRGLLNRPGAVPQNLLTLAEHMAVAGRNAGEPARPRLVNGREPRSIELAVKKRMQDAGIPIPVISKTPRVT